jgi:hypothetical protein
VFTKILFSHYEIIVRNKKNFAINRISNICTADTILMYTTLYYLQNLPSTTVHQVDIVQSCVHDSDVNAGRNLGG